MRFDAGPTYDDVSNCTHPGRKPRLGHFMDKSLCNEDSSCLEEYNALFESCGGTVAMLPCFTYSCT